MTAFVVAEEEGPQMTPELAAALEKFTATRSAPTYLKTAWEAAK